MSKIGWIDFSPTDRDKVNTALAMLTEPGTLDELGIGRIRDGYADQLFPGISTIQTRAKYFITVPRILRDYCSLPVKNKKAYKGVKPYMKKYENDTAVRLLLIHGDEEDGIIGRNRVESGGVDRAPSVIYWNGLRTFEIIKTTVSFNDFCRQIDSQQFETEKLHQHDDAEAQSVSYGLIDTPTYDPNWLESDAFSLKLTKSEAEFLREKIISAANIKHSILVQLLLNMPLALTALKLVEQPGHSQYSNLSSLLSQSEGIHHEAKYLATLADEFSHAMEGPHIAFNIVYALAVGEQSVAENYHHQYKNWLENVLTLQIFQPDCAAKWINAACLKGNTRSVYTFVDDVSNLVISGGNINDMMHCVEKRARENKKERSILAAKKQMNVDGKLNWVGIRRLDYRWNTAKVILDDILGGLGVRS